MNRRTLTISVLRWRILESGLWCDRCALPSVVVLELLLGGDCVPGYLVRRCCTDCGHADPTPA